MAGHAGSPSAWPEPDRPAGGPGSAGAAGSPSAWPEPGYGTGGAGTSGPPAGYGPGGQQPEYGTAASFGRGGPPPGYGQPGYGQAGYGQAGQGQAGYGQAGYGEAGYGPAYGAQQPGYGQPGPAQPGYGPPRPPGQSPGPGGQAGPSEGYGADPQPPGYGQPGYGQPGAAPGYGAGATSPRPSGQPGQPGQPPGYGQPAPQPGYGQPYGSQPPQQPGYWQPGAPAGYRPGGTPPGGYSGRTDQPPGFSQAETQLAFGPPGSQPRGGTGAPQPGYGPGESGAQAGYGPGGAGAQPGYGPGPRPGYGQDAQAGYGQGAAAGYGQDAQPGYGQGPRAGYGQDAAAGYGQDAAAGYGQGAAAAFGAAGAGAGYQYAGAQPGYAGSQDRGTAFPGGPADPDRRKRRRNLLIVLAAAVVLIVVLAIALPLALGGGESVATMGLKAGQSLSAADGIGYSGTIAKAPADLSVTRAGTVQGSYTQGTSQVTRVTVGGVTYLNAPVGFWTADGIAQKQATQAGGHWAKAPADAVSLAFDSLTPAQVARVLEHVGPKATSAAQTYHGTKVTVLTTGGVQYYLTSAEPNRLIHVAGGSGVNAYAFDVKPLSAAAVKPVFTTLHSDIQNLAGAADPAAEVDGGTPKFLDCSTATRCTVDATATVSDPTAPADFTAPPLLLKMTVEFAPTQNAKPFTSCSTTIAVPSAAALKPGCGVTGGEWTSWFNSHTGHFSVWADASYEVTVNSAASVATLQTAVSHEQGAS